MTENSESKVVIRQDVCQKGFDVLDEALAKFVNENNLNYIEIYNIIKLLETKVIVHFIQSVSRDTFNDGIQNIAKQATDQKIEEDKRTGRSGYIS